MSCDRPNWSFPESFIVTTLPNAGLSAATKITGKGVFQITSAAQAYRSSNFGFLVNDREVPQFVLGLRPSAFQYSCYENFPIHYHFQRRSKYYQFLVGLGEDLNKFLAIKCERLIRNIA